MSKFNATRRDTVRLIGAGLLATPFLSRSGFAQSKQVVTVLGVPGLHIKLWENWAKMIAEDTQGKVEVKYDPLGYAPAFAKIKTEVDSGRNSTDLFYGDAPYPERLVLDGLISEIPYSSMPGTKELSSFARGTHTLEIFRTNWGVVGYNTNYMSLDKFDLPVSWEAFLNPKLKGRVGWVDPRGFPVWVPIFVELFGDDGWIDFATRLHANIGAYQPRWIDSRQALQRGDTVISLYNFSTTYISAEVDKASVRGIPITSGAPKTFGVLPVSIGALKAAPSKEAAFKVMDMICTAKYAKVMMDIGLNPSNNQSNYPHPLADKTLALNSADKVGITSWQQVQDRTLGIDWVNWADKLEGYVKQWEQKVLKA